MNQLNEVMQMNDSAGEYLAPTARVVMVKIRRVMCSSGFTEDSTEESTDGWY